MYGPWQIGALSAEDYVKRAREFAKVMSWTDPEIELVACGENGLSDWDRIVVDGLADQVRWHSIHIYTGSDDYWTDVLSPHQAERALRRVDRADRRHPLSQADRPPDPRRLRRVERVVPRARGGPRGALHARRRACRRHLPARVRPPLPGRADGQPGPAGQRDRADRHLARGPVPADDLPPAAPVRRPPAAGGARRPRRVRRPTSTSRSRSPAAGRTASPTSGRSRCSTSPRCARRGGGGADTQCRQPLAERRDRR